MPNYSAALSGVGGLVGGPIGAGIGSLVGAGIGLLTGRKQKKQGNSLVNQPYPEYQIPGEVTRAAAEGLPSQQYANAMKNIQRQQAQALYVAQSRRGGLATIGRIQQGTNDATLNLDVADATMKNKNEQILAGYKDKQWNWNKRDKYQRDYEYGMNLLGAGNQNTNTGIDKLGAGIGLLAGGGAFGKRLKSKPQASQMDYNNSGYYQGWGNDPMITG